MAGRHHGHGNARRLVRRRMAAAACAFVVADGRGQPGRATVARDAS